jgi:hypothetical protein
MGNWKVPDFETFFNKARYYQALCEEYAARAPTADLREAMMRMSSFWEVFIRNLRRDAEVFETSQRLLVEADDLLKKV